MDKYEEIVKTSDIETTYPPMRTIIVFVYDPFYVKYPDLR